MKNKLLLLLLMQVLCLQLIGQSCLDNYLQAVERYNAGYWSEVLPILEDSCFLKRNYGNEVDLTNALMLRTELALRRKNDSIAMNFMEEILHINPTIKIDTPAQDIELKYLRRKFKILYPGSVLFFAGTGLTEVRVGQAYSINILNDETSLIKRDPVPSAFAGARIELNTKWGVGAVVGGLISYDQYNYAETIRTSDLERQYTELDFREQTFSASGQVGVRFGVPTSPKEAPSFLRSLVEKPYFIVAAEPSLVIFSRMKNLNRVLQTQVDGTDQQPDVIFSDRKINLVESGQSLRSRFQMAGYAGFGWEIPIPNSLNSVVLEAGYSFAFLNAVVKKNRYTNDKLVFAYGYLDDDFYQNHIRFSIAYSINDFKVKRID